jgi:hypothetical protein
MIEEEVASQSQQNGQQAGQTGDDTAEQISDAATVSDDAERLADVLSPVLSWERNNVEFWVQIGQLIVLLLILREVSS